MSDVHSPGFVLDVKTTWTYVNSKYYLDILIWKKNMLLIFLLSLMDQHFFKDAYYPTIKVNQHYKYLKHSLDVNTYLGGQQVEVNYLESLRGRMNVQQCHNC